MSSTNEPTERGDAREFLDIDLTVDDAASVRGGITHGGGAGKVTFNPLTGEPDASVAGDPSQWG